MRICRPRQDWILRSIKNWRRSPEPCRFDALFVADSLASATDSIAERMARSTFFEPLVVRWALAAVIERTGRIATSAKNYNVPCYVVRILA